MQTTRLLAPVDCECRLQRAMCVCVCAVVVNETFGESALIL